jgi:hypothetical protein
LTFDLAFDLTLDGLSSVTTGPGAPGEAPAAPEGDPNAERDLDDVARPGTAVPDQDRG